MSTRLKIRDLWDGAARQVIIIEGSNKTIVTEFNGRTTVTHFIRGRFVRSYTLEAK